MSKKEKLPLGEIFHIARGGSPRPIQKFITSDKDGIPWIMIGDASEVSKYISDTKKRIIKEGVKSSRIVNPGDFILSNSMSFGHPYIMKISGCIHDGWLVLSPTRDDIDQDYFYYLLGSDTVYQEFSRRASGTTVKNLNIDLVSSVKVSFPPLEEQRRIAAILDKADAVRRKREEAIRLTEELLRSLFLDMFGDPVTNPMGWEVDYLGKYILHANNGLSRRRKVTQNEGEIVLRLQDVKTNYISFTEPNRIALNEDEKKRYLLKQNDLIFIRVNGNKDYVGRCAVYKDFYENVYHNDHIIRIQTSSRISSEYLAFIFNYSAGKQMLNSQIKTSAGQYTISQKGIESIKIPIPPTQVQYEFIKYSELLKTTISKHKSLLEQSSNLFNSLLQKAFRGEL